MIHEALRQSYGVPRVYRELREDGVDVGRDRVARLMRQAGLQGISRRRFVVTTRRDEGGRAAPDLVELCFKAEGPNQLWVADISYIPTLRGGGLDGTRDPHSGRARPLTRAHIGSGLPGGIRTTERSQNHFYWASPWSTSPGDGGLQDHGIYLRFGRFYLAIQ
jgi:transposase InsO family protein